MRISPRSCFLNVVLLLLAACSLPMNANLGVNTWIDEPLRNTRYVIGETVEITVHATDHAAGEVQAVALFLNNELLVTLPEADSGSDLQVFTYPYQANASGDFLLQAAAQNGAGQWGEFAETTFSVGDFMVSSPLHATTAPAAIPPTDASPVTVSPTGTPLIDVSPATSTPTPVPPTPTLSPTPSLTPSPTPSPTPTSTPSLTPTMTSTPLQDTQRPVIIELEWSPLSPLEDEPVTFFVLAQDNDGVTLIEIYFVRQGDSEVPLHTCSFAEECDFTAPRGFSGGTYSYFAKAYDAAGNQVSTFIQTVLVQEVIE